MPADDTEIEVEAADSNGYEGVETWMEDPDTRYDVDLSGLTNRQMLILHTSLVNHHAKFQPLHAHAEDTRELIETVNAQNPRFSDRAAAVFEAAPPPDSLTGDWLRAVHRFFDSPLSDRDPGDRFDLDDMLWGLAIALVILQALVSIANLVAMLGDSFGVAVLPGEIPYATPIVATTAVLATIGFTGAMGYGLARRRLDME